MPEEYVAFVDESEPRQDRLPGSYLLASAVVRDEDLDAVRTTAAPLRRAGQTKAHWRDATSRSGRMELVRGVATADLLSLVVVRTGNPSDSTERRRRLCLQRLCFELQDMGVNKVVMESRGPGDKRDRHLLDTLRARKVIGPNLRLDHLPGPEEPALWLADIVCGAVSWDRLGESSYLDVIRDRTILIEI